MQYDAIKYEYESCKKYIQFYQIVLSNFELFKDIITKQELVNQLNYYRDNLIFLRKDLKKYEIRN